MTQCARQAESKRGGVYRWLGGGMIDCRGKRRQQQLWPAASEGEENGDVHAFFSGLDDAMSPITAVIQTE